MTQLETTPKSDAPDAITTRPDGPPTPAESALAWAIATATTPGHEIGQPPRVEADAWADLGLAPVRHAMDTILVSKHPDEGLEALLIVGALDHWLPEVTAMVGFGDGEWRHKDVWKHTKQVVKQSVPRLEVRWGALLHDIGKVSTRRIDDRGNVTFYGHSEVGARMFKRTVKKRLGFQGAFAERVHFLILFHLRPGQYKASWTDAAVRRFYKQMGDGLRDLLDLGRADITTKRPEKRRRGVRQISLLKKRIDGLREVDQKVAPLPKGLGNAMMEQLGVPPSKRLGDIKKSLEAEVEAGTLEGGRDAEFYVDYLREHAARFGI